MYSPKIREEHIPILYRLAKQRRMPMTGLVDEFLREGLKTLNVQRIEESSAVFLPDILSGTYQNSKILEEALRGLKIKLDCGHHCTIGHQFANTLIIFSTGGGRLETWCHSCY